MPQVQVLPEPEGRLKIVYFLFLLLLERCNDNESGSSFEVGEKDFERRKRLLITASSRSYGFYLMLSGFGKSLVELLIGLHHG